MAVLSTLAVILLTYSRRLVLSAVQPKVCDTSTISAGAWCENLPFPPHMAIPCSAGFIAVFRTAVRMRSASHSLVCSLGLGTSGDLRFF